MNSTPPQSERQRILAIETSTVACSVAIRIDHTNGTTTDSIKQEIPRSHNQALLGMVHDLLLRNGISVSELSAICFGRGPGSFTGTRIAAAVTQGLSLPFGIPIYAVSSLHALAAGAFSQHPECCGVLSFIRSRPGEYYRGVHRIKNGETDLVGEEEICQVNSLYPDTKVMRSSNNPGGDKQSGHCGWLAVFDELPVPNPGDRVPDAPEPIFEDDKRVAVLFKRPDAEGMLAVPEAGLCLVDVAEAVPVYIQGTKPWKKQSV